MQSLENRIPPPLVAMIFALAMWVLAFFDTLVALNSVLRMSSAGLFVLLGLAFALAGVISFKRSKTTVNPLRPSSASALVTGGVYKITRNPMYVGFVLFLLAWAAYLSSLASLIVVFMFMVFIQRFQILPEERALLSLFGQEFKDYMQNVRRWL